MSVKETIKRLARRFGFEIVRAGTIPADLRRLRSDFTREDHEAIRGVTPYTQTSPERLASLIRAVEYVAKNRVTGAIVECGVWRGGSMMAAAQTLLRLGVRDRDLYLFDTFEGMAEPTREDVSHWGLNAAERFREYRNAGTDEAGLFEANVVPLDQVKRAMDGVGYDRERVHFVKGKVEDTLPGSAPEAVALLRLDTDWYESTKHEMVHLFPRLARGGVLILDDYGEWAGARKAVDEYIEENRIPILLSRIDYTGRIGIKL